MRSPRTNDVVQRLADLEAIRDLARRYAHCVWQKDITGAITLFDDEGEMHTGDRPPICGRAALLEAYRTILRNDANFQPFVHNHVVELNGDRATGTCYLDLRAVVDGKSMIGAGYYNDEYVRTEGTWKFSRRELKLSWFVPLSEGWVRSETQS